MGVLTSEAKPLGVARRAAFVFGLWIGFWLLAASVELCLMYVPYSQARYDNSIGLSGFVAIMAALSLLIALRPRTKSSKRSQTPPLARDKIPALYALVEQIGAQAGVKAPIGIFLLPQTNASISAQRNWYGRIKRLEVCLGYGLFCILSKDELSSVIAHEYGHFVGGDLGLGPWVYRTRNSIGKTLDSLESSIFLLDWPFRVYATWFLKCSATISRAQEYAADALAGRLFDPKTACAALEKTHSLGAQWTVYLGRDLMPAINRGAKLPIRPGFATFLASQAKRAEVLQSIEKALAQEFSPFDTHPSLEQRVQALISSAPNENMAPAECVNLLGSGTESESLWYTQFINGQTQPTSWELFGDEVLLPKINARFANTFLSPDAVPLTSLIDLVADTEALWVKTKPSGVSFFSVLAKKKYVLDILQEFVIASLSKAGYRASTRPGEYLVMTRGEGTIRPDQLLKNACEGRTSVEELQSLINTGQLIPEA